MGGDEILTYAALIKEKISYENLLERYPLDPDLVEGIYELILETVISKSESMVIARSEFPMELVRSKFLKLNSLHIEYVIGCMQSNTTKVKNITVAKIYCFVAVWFWMFLVICATVTVVNQRWDQTFLLVFVGVVTFGALFGGLMIEAILKEIGNCLKNSFVR